MGRAASNDGSTTTDGISTKATRASGERASLFLWELDGAGEYPKACRLEAIGFISMSGMFFSGDVALGASR